MLRKHVNHTMDFAPNKLQFLKYYRENPSLKDQLYNWTKIGLNEYKFTKGLGNYISVLIRSNEYLDDKYSILFCADKSEFF